MSDNYPMGHRELIDFDTYYENMENHIKELERQLKEAERKEKAYIDFCNSLFFDLDPKDKRLLKLREQLKEQGE